MTRTRQSFFSRTPSGKESSGRLGWLDAMRGIAALSVAVYHLALPFYWVPYGTEIPRYLDPGIFGVMLFFLVSGYIVPVSLERRGDVRAFWIGRLFRIYPVVIVFVTLFVTVLPRKHAPVAGDLYDHPVLTILANATMLQDVVQVTGVLGVMWTLTFEMVFYYLVTALFAAGRQRASGAVAVGFAAVGLLLGGVIPSPLLADDPQAVRHVVAAAAVITVFGLGALLSGHPALTRTAAFLLAGTGLALSVLNSRPAPFETLTVFATMFASTLIRRAEQGQVPKVVAGFCCSFVIVAGFVSAYLYDHGQRTAQRTWTANWQAFAFAYLAAWAVFLGAMALRKRRFPRFLTWLGTISYSVYLLHTPLIHGMNRLLAGHGPFNTWGDRLLLFGGFMAAMLAVGLLSYRLVELPFQKLGRRLDEAARTRFPAPRDPVAGADAAPRPRATELVLSADSR